MAGPNSAGGRSSVRKTKSSTTQSSGAGSVPRAVLPVGSSKRAELTDRDIDILTWITRHGVVTTEQIAKKFFPGTSGFSAAQRRIRKLTNTHPPVIRRDRTFWRYPAVIRVTASGANLTDCDLRPARLVLAEVAHSLGIVDLTEQLLAEHPGATLITERERRAERYRDKRAGERKATGRIPDGVLVLHSNPREIAIELDLSPRREKTVEAIVRAYQAERYAGVWWYVRPDRVARIAEIVKRCRADSFIEVRPWQAG
jgi:DNA-binding CsgD family transcriptional regulator